MEMMVAIAILSVVIVGVAVAFRTTSRAVGISQAAMEMFSNVRCFEHQVDSDFHGINRNGFLVIRGRMVAGRRCDQVCFLANGDFPNRTGSAEFSYPFSDQSRSNAAVVWYGHAVVLSGTATGGAQSDALPMDAAPAGNTDADFWLCRHTRLLMAASSLDDTVGYIVGGDTKTIPAYKTAFWDAPALSFPNSTEPPAHITSARFSAVALAPAQLLEELAVGRVHQPRFEADKLCFRFKVLPNIYATEVLDGNGKPSLINGVFRMHPVFLQGTPDFAVDWTDGTSDASGALHWYGLGNPKYPGGAGEQVNEPALANGDGYTGIFNGNPNLIWLSSKAYQAGDFVDMNGMCYRATRATSGNSPTGGSGDWVAVSMPEWPRAIRLSYRVTDANNRLEGGRQFVQIISLESR